jgi:hypothetical protein
MVDPFILVADIVCNDSIERKLNEVPLNPAQDDLAAGMK